LWAILKSKHIPLCGPIRINDSAATANLVPWKRHFVPTSRKLQFEDAEALKFAEIAFH
jgi:hypothetical protein